MDESPEPQQGDVRKEGDRSHAAGQAEALKLIVARQNIARPFAAPPGVPKARIEALRRAFDTTMRDPEFLAEAKQLDLEVRPAAGAEVQALMSELHAAPADVVRMATDFIRETP